jgi:hypothetical protein
MLASATNVVTNFVFNLPRFELAADTTYDLYVYAANSGRVHTFKLLPPEFPKIQVWFRRYGNTPQTTP